jgi:hypothetical protein
MVPYLSPLHGTLPATAWYLTCHHCVVHSLYLSLLRGALYLFTTVWCTKKYAVLANDLVLSHEPLHSSKHGAKPTLIEGAAYALRPNPLFAKAFAFQLCDLPIACLLL